MSQTNPFTTALSTDLVRHEWNRSTPGAAVLDSLAIGASLILGIALHHRAAGSIGAAAAYTAGFALFHTVLGSRLFSMLLVTCAITLGTLIGSYAAAKGGEVYGALVIVAVIYSVLSSVGSTSAWLGQFWALFVVINSFFHQGPQHVIGGTLVVLAGGVLQMLIFVSFTLLTKRRFPSLPTRDEVRSCCQQLWARVWRKSPRRRTAAFALQLFVTLTLATWIYRHWGFKSGFWAPLTTLMVLQPQWATSISHAVARMGGTVLGAATFFGVVVFVYPRSFQLTTYVVLTMFFAWICLTIHAVNYAAFGAAMCLFIVFLFHAGGLAERSEAGLRLEMTALGGGIALISNLVWMLLVHISSRTRYATA